VGLLTDRVALVTGSTRGLGASIAQRLYADGAFVVVTGRDAEAARRSADRLGVRARGYALDVTRPETIRAAVTAITDEFGRLEVLVNNAGILGPTTPLWDTSDADWGAVLETNLTGVFNCCRAIVPIMLEGGYGRIVNIASMAGKEGNVNSSAYSAAKAGVIALTKSLGKETATRSVLVNCVVPGLVESDMNRGGPSEQFQLLLSRIPMGRIARPTELAALVAWLASDECSFSTGAAYDLSGGRATY
jgi:3-oxoacyl-[acyl-carrier protein] reductase